MAFLWWEVLLVKQTGQIIDLKQKISELSVTNETKLIQEIQFLHQKKKMQVIHINDLETIPLQFTTPVNYAQNIAGIKNKKNKN